MNTGSNAVVVTEIKREFRRKKVVLHDDSCGAFKGCDCDCDPVVDEAMPGEFWWIK
jgi:hypothetical protein